MNKIIVIFIVIITIILSLLYGYFTYTKNNSLTVKHNAEYESYYNKEIYGAELATIINKVIDNNEENKVSKDNKGIYIDDNSNSIQMDLKIIDNNKIYKAETIETGGIDNFVKNYNTIKFKCTDIKYHTSTKKIKYLLFEQITK